MSTWHPQHGECLTSWKVFKSKRERDYKASVAHKTTGYLTHTIGDFRARGATHYWLSVYLKES